MSYEKSERQHQAFKLMSRCLHTLLYGGARSRKSASFCHALVVRAAKCKSRHLITRQHFKDARIAIGNETMPFILESLGFGDTAVLNKTDWYWTIPPYV